jgi:hypothetical protein
MNEIPRKPASGRRQPPDNAAMELAMESYRGADAPRSPARWSIYVLLIVITTGILVARVVRLDSRDPKIPTPFLSANDRSRWATIRSLGDDGTYVIDDMIFDAKGNRARGWHTIDLVRHRGADGKEHYYSSKPTLLTTLLAGEYWLVKKITAATLAEQPHYVSRLVLVLTNVLPLAGALLLLARLVDRYGTTDWGRLLAMAAACFATFLTTFAVTLNNHLTAAISLVVGLAAVVPIVSENRRDGWRFALAGLSFGFLAANELPALSLLVLAGTYLLWKAPLPTALAFVPAALVVAAAAFGTNILAHGDWRTPYAHRKDGPVITMLADDLAVPLNAGELLPSVPEELAKHGIEISERAVIEQRVRGDRWTLWDGPTRTELTLQRTPEGERNGGIRVQRADNWYDYPGSYWQPKNLRGIDRGESSPAVYALHVLIGHHGLFSLTPLWLLSAAGCWFWLFPASGRREPPDDQATSRRLIAATTILITVVVLGFYLTRPQIDRNYGGATCCLRWLLWLTPLWILTLSPAVDRMSHSRWGRGVVLALLLISVFSAHYAADNPWSHPWLFDYWTAIGWIKY